MFRCQFPELPATGNEDGAQVSAQNCLQQQLIDLPLQHRLFELLWNLLLNDLIENRNVQRV